MEPISEGRAQAATTAGAWLRNARQQRGLHIAALAVMLKVPQAKLEALESDRFDLLPDATFTRALATAMCRALKVDPSPVLSLLPRSSEQGFDVRPGLNQPFRERGAGGSGVDGSVLAIVTRPVVWGPALLLVAAAAIYWFPAGWVAEHEAGAASPAAAASGSVVTTVARAPVDFIPAPAASASVAPVAMAGPGLVASAPVPVASAPLQVRPVAPPPAAASASVQPVIAAAPGSALRVTATADTWIEVVDAQGQVLLSRVVREGEQQEYSGAAPYKVRVGNVRGTKLEWRGAAVDLAARGSNNVARLELN